MDCSRRYAVAGKNYQDLIAWQRAMGLVESVHQLTGLAFFSWLARSGA
jgi:hypothetical protein